MSGDDFKKLVASAKRLVKKMLLGANRLYKAETAGALENFLEERHML